MFRFHLVLGVSLLAASASSAHPGHGEAGQAFTLAHQFGEPIHAIGTLVLAGVIVAGWRLLQSRRAAAARSEGDRRPR